MLDAGTGDGRYPLHVARTRADTLAIGLDAVPDALAYAGRFAARERLPNLALLCAPVEQLGLDRIADEVTVHFPWGSLLRGALAEDENVLSAISRLPRVGGALTLLVSLIDRDGHPPLTERDISRVINAYRARGYTLVDRRPAALSDVVAARSSWGKRLGVGRTRPGLLLRFLRDSGVAAPPVGSESDDR